MEASKGENATQNQGIIPFVGLILDRIILEGTVMYIAHRLVGP
jgi:hypothetical protein